MRITNKYLVKTFLSDLNINLENMKKFQEQLSSGKELRRPSDDPFAVTRSMTLNSSINRNTQYQRNIEDSIGWLDTTDTALGQIGDSLQRIRELMLAASNGTNTQSELDAYRAEIQQKIEEIGQSGNTNFDGRYIFGGTLTTDKPFDVSKDGSGEISYNGNDQVIKREISPGVTIDINVNGSQMLAGTDVKGTDHDMVSALQNVVSALNKGDYSALGGDLVDDVQANIDNILRLRADVGAKSNRMESAKSKNEDETLNLTEMLSKVEDIDIAEKIMQYKVMESVYQASLMSGAKIIQPSLIDFLR
jgi:flagellar hook-associated protein 3 FlgL